MRVRQYSTSKVEFNGLQDQAKIVSSVFYLLTFASRTSNVLLKCPCYNSIIRSHTPSLMFDARKYHKVFLISTLVFASFIRKDP